MRHLKFILFAIFAFALASCATGPKIDYAGISSNIQSSEKGGIIGGFDSKGLSYATLTVENVDTGSRSNVSFSTAPRVYSLNPGKYEIKSGRVGGYNVTGNMPLIGLWAEEFEVKAGEVTALGDLQMNTIKNNVKTSGGSKVLNALNSFGTNVNNDVTHVSFNVQPMQEKRKEKALSKFTGLESHVVDRPLKLRFTETEFQSMINEASAKNEEGKLPTRKDIQSKLAASLLMKMIEKKGLGKLSKT